MKPWVVVVTVFVSLIMLGVGFVTLFPGENFHSPSDFQARASLKQPAEDEVEITFTMRERSDWWREEPDIMPVTVVIDSGSGLEKYQTNVTWQLRSGASTFHWPFEDQRDQDWREYGSQARITLGLPWNPEDGLTGFLTPSDLEPWWVIKYHFEVQPGPDGKPTLKSHVLQKTPYDCQKQPFAPDALQVLPDSNETRFGIEITNPYTWPQEVIIAQGWTRHGGSPFRAFDVELEPQSTTFVPLPIDLGGASKTYVTIEAWAPDGLPWPCHESLWSFELVDGSWVIEPL